MLDINFIRLNTDLCKKAADDKNFAVDFDRVLALDAELRELTGQIEPLRAERNALSKGKPTPEQIERVRAIKPALSALEEKHSETKAALEYLMLTIPSVPCAEVPIGNGEEDNVVLRHVGEKPIFNFAAKDHMELADLHDLVDIPRGVKCAGSRSYFLKNDAVLLEQAVLRLALDMLVARGYTPLTVPFMVNEASMMGTGYLPLGRDQAYHMEKDDLYLIGTSEVSVVSYHRDEILDAKDFPLRYAGLSTCFRREAGTYGKDTRGLYRIHQFQKTEQVIFIPADEKLAEQMHYELLQNAEDVLQALELPYRVSIACTGDLGQGQTRKHEVETWMPSRDAYCETHSCSTFGDFQARRSNIRHRDADGNLKFCYTLNNTAIASPRILIPLLENHQRQDGSIYIPKALVPYFGKNEIK